MFVSLTTRLKRQRESELWPVRKKFETLQVLVKNQWQIQDWGGDTTNLLSDKIFAENCMKMKKKTWTERSACGDGFCLSLPISFSVTISEDTMIHCSNFALVYKLKLLI